MAVGHVDCPHQVAWPGNSVDNVDSTLPSAGGPYIVGHVGNLFSIANVAHNMAPVRDGDFASIQLVGNVGYFGGSSQEVYPI